MGYRHYLYAVPKNQVAEIQTCKTNEDWCNFATRFLNWFGYIRFSTGRMTIWF